MKSKFFNPGMIMSGAKAAAGFLAGSAVSSMLKDKDTGEVSIGGILVPLLGAGVVAGFVGKKGAEIAVGMAASGAINALRKFAGPDLASTLGLSGIGYLPPIGSTSVHSVAGIGRSRMNGSYSDAHVVVD